MDTDLYRLSVLQSVKRSPFWISSRADVLHAILVDVGTPEERIIRVDDICAAWHEAIRLPDMGDHILLAPIYQVSPEEGRLLDGMVAEA